MGSKLHKRGVEACKRYLEMRGYEIVEQGWSCEHAAGGFDLVADDHGCIAFAQVAISTLKDCGFREAPMSREQAEFLSALYLGERPEYVDRQFRFDRLSLMVVGEDRAVIRHHVNVFGAGD